MPKYAELAPEVQAIIDRSVPKFAIANCCTEETARELLAARVRKPPNPRPTHGTGH